MELIQDYLSSLWRMLVSARWPVSESNPEYAYLRDEGDALQCALTNGESRFGKAAKRGTGFSQLFKSLATLNASLRFRSGDHALTMAGKSPTLVNAHVAKKPRASGFLTSVRCKTAAGQRVALCLSS